MASLKTKAAARTAKTNHYIKSSSTDSGASILIGPILLSVRSYSRKPQDDINTLGLQTASCDGGREGEEGKEGEIRNAAGQG